MALNEQQLQHNKQQRIEKEKSKMDRPKRTIKVHKWAKYDAEEEPEEIEEDDCTEQVAWVRGQKQRRHQRIKSKWQMS